MNYGSTESQNESYERQSSITTLASSRLRIERKFLLSGIQVFGYSVGHIHNDICSAMWFNYFIIFLEQVLNFSPKTSGLLLLIGQIADGLATPIVGLESDRHIETCHAYGKRKTWHLIGTILSFLTFPFIFQPCYGGEHATQGALIFYYSMLIIIFQFAWASIQINHMSMATDLTPYSCERVKLTARRSSFTVISNIIVFLFTWLVLHLSRNHSGDEKDAKFNPEDAPQFRIIVISLCGIGLLFSILFHVFVTEKDHNIQLSKPNDDESNLVDFSDRSNHLKWKDWFGFFVFYRIAALYMVSRLIINLTQVYVPLYLNHTLDLNKEALAYIPLVIYCSGFVGSILVEIINKKLSNIQIFFCGSIISMNAFIWIHFGTSECFAKKYIYFVSILIGLSSQTININSQSILNDLIGQNTASSAFVFGAMSLLDKGANGAGVMIIQSMRGAKTEINFFRNVLSYVCGGASLAAILILLTIISHNFEVDLKKDKLRTNVSNNTNSDHNYPIERTNNLVECDNEDNEERALLSYP